jgi:peptide/nickel transport system substrate-binding protein
LRALRWGGATLDAETRFTPVLRSPDGRGAGSNNAGRVNDPGCERLAVASRLETDPAKRQVLVKAALQRARDHLLLLPLHRQAISWAARDNVDAVHRAGNVLDIALVRLR